jgi:hypothetical protein
MVENFAPVPLWDGTTLQSIGVRAVEKAEMNLARMAARRGSFPTVKEELQAMRQLKILPIRARNSKESEPFVILYSISAFAWLDAVSRAASWLFRRTAKR